MRLQNLVRLPTLVTIVSATLGLVSSAPAEESKDFTAMRFTVVTERDDTTRGDFTVPYRLARKWRSLASAPDDAIEERVLQTGTVLGQQLFSDVEIKGNTIYLWVPPHRPLHDPDRWSFYSDLADMMVVRCGCIDGTAAVASDSAVLESAKRPIQYFRFNVENGRSRIDLK